jgi:hypothetical protein
VVLDLYLISPGTTIAFMIYPERTHSVKDTIIAWENDLPSTPHPVGYEGIIPGQILKYQFLLGELGAIGEIAWNDHHTWRKGEHKIRTLEGRITQEAASLRWEFGARSGSSYDWFPTVGLDFIEDSDSWREMNRLIDQGLDPLHATLEHVPSGLMFYTNFGFSRHIYGTGDHMVAWEPLWNPIEGLPTMAQLNYRPGFKDTSGDLLLIPKGATPLEIKFKFVPNHRLII